MTLKAVQDTSTNWTPSEWKKIERLKKTLADSDNRSGRPWSVGRQVNDLVPRTGPQYLREVDVPGNSSLTGNFAPTRDPVMLHDLALEVGETPQYLQRMAGVDEAWAEKDRVADVAFTVFKVLTPYLDRKQLLTSLLKEKAPFDITANDARRVVGIKPNVLKGLKEWVSAFSSRLDGFMNQRLYAADRLELEKVRLKIDILLGDAEAEEAS